MFARITASNFLSWEDLDFEFQNGTTLIEGWNADENTSEGSGKSAILNALCWGLYGRIPKDANIDDVIREGEKSCSVQIFLTDGTSVTRSRKPNQVFLTNEDGEQIFGKDAKETQLLIDQHIGVGFDTFCQSVYFAQNYSNKFITAGETDKSKILSEILDLKVFDRARDAVAKDLKKLDIEVAVAQKTALSAAQAYEVSQNHVRDLETMIEDMDSQQKARLEEIKVEMNVHFHNLETLNENQPEASEAELTEIYEELTAQIEVLTQQDKKIASELAAFNQKIQRKNSLKTAILKQQARVDKAEQKLQSFKQQERPACPTCGRGFHAEDESHAKKIFDDLSSEFESERENYLEIQTELAQVADVDADVLKYRTLQAEVGKQKSELNSNLQFVLKSLAALRVYENDRNRVQQNINFLSSQHEQASQYDNKPMLKKLEAAKDHQATAETAWNEAEARFDVVREESKQLSLLRDSFKEIKSYVFQGVLDELTRRSNLYLGELFEIPLRIDFNNQGEGGEISKITTEVTIHDIQRPLGLYSGGQSRRIQLAVDLALSDIIAARGTKPIPLRVMDEYFKDLSTESMEKILGLLERLPGSTVLVEHNQLFKSIVNRVFSVQFENGTSRAEFRESL